MKHDRTTLKILPEMELLAGVQWQTGWIQTMGPDGKGSKYFQALRTFFDPYKNHRAVMLSQKLTDAGFSYDAPPAFICHIGPLPDLKLQHDYGDYLLGRSGGPEPLEEFRLALRDLASESCFLSFYQDQETYLNSCLDKSKPRLIGLEWLHHVTSNKRDKASAVNERITEALPFLTKPMVLFVGVRPH